MEIVNQVSLSKFYCSICNYYTSRSNDLLKHNKTLKHIKNNNDSSDNNLVEKKTYTCNICNKLFKTNGGLWKHKKKACLKKEETNTLKYYCEKCNYTTKSNRDYNKHINTKKHINNIQPTLVISNNIEENEKKPKTYSCFVCNYNTTKTTDYETHCQTIKHDNNTNTNSAIITKPEIHKCKNCNKEYKDRTGLWRHNKNCNTVINNESDNLDEPQNVEKLIEENKLLKQFIKDIIINYHNDIKLFTTYLKTKA